MHPSSLHLCPSNSKASFSSPIMELAQTFFLPLVLCLLSLSTQQSTLLVSAGHHHHGRRHHHRHSSDSTDRYLFDWRPTKLFVFGDSYSDTGNNPKPFTKSWKYPYGITFPGKPSGRFSDGRVLTDFLAKFIGVKSPLPYKFRNVGVKHLKAGMNFAYGGTGVFNTLVAAPNMTTQLDLFQQFIIKDSVFTAQDLHSSVALITVSGNDYAYYMATNNSPQGFKSFITSVVNQLSVNLKRVYDLGVKKIVVTALQPLGCLPDSTAEFSFQKCNATQNLLVVFHNLLLQQAVAKLNNETQNSFMVLDLYTSFMSVFKNKGNHTGSIKFENPLKPCCVGISRDYDCGSVDGSGAKKYTICDDPEAAFFWDGAHPTQQSWLSVYSALQAMLEELF